jgi:hypothetical protein
MRSRFDTMRTPLTGTLDTGKLLNSPHNPSAKNESQLDEGWLLHINDSTYKGAVGHRFVRQGLRVES